MKRSLQSKLDELSAYIVTLLDTAGISNDAASRVRLKSIFEDVYRHAAERVPTAREVCASVAESQLSYSPRDRQVMVSFRFDVGYEQEARIWAAQVLGRADK